jgi:hypothetical protein
VRWAAGIAGDLLAEFIEVDLGLGLSDHQCPATTTDIAKATPTAINVA